MERENNRIRVTKWVVETVEKEYRDDIALVVSHTTLRIEGEETPVVSYFVPITDRGRRFARTFILDGEGYDLWAIEWERLERFAELLEYNITCLADAELLYAKTPEDAERFEKLKERLAANLADPAAARAKALESYEQAKKIYLEMLFSDGSDVRLGAGYVLDYLARAIAFTNRRYFRKTQAEQMEELSDMELCPEKFVSLYRQVIWERQAGEQKRLCYELIRLVKQFLESLQEKKAREFYFQDLADWYCELSYTWMRIRYYCGRGDVIRAYMWGIYLQQELNIVCDDFGLEKMELMEAFDPDSLEEFVRRSDNLEQEMRRRIEAGGGIIHEYSSFEEFVRGV